MESGGLIGRRFLFGAIAFAVAPQAQNKNAGYEIRRFIPWTSI
jgi:hypothetical protein